MRAPHLGKFDVRVGIVHPLLCFVVGLYSGGNWREFLLGIPLQVLYVSANSASNLRQIVPDNSVDPCAGPAEGPAEGPACLS